MKTNDTETVPVSPPIHHEGNFKYPKSRNAYKVRARLDNQPDQIDGHFVLKTVFLSVFSINL